MQHAFTIRGDQSSSRGWFVYFFWSFIYFCSLPILQECLEKKQSGEPQEEESPRFSQKDLQMAEKVSKYNVSTALLAAMVAGALAEAEMAKCLLCASFKKDSKRGESLLSMHTKKMKSKAEADASKPVERRPFDRDADLQVNRFDEAQKRSLLKKSQELNTRFLHSKDRMFL